MDKKSKENFVFKQLELLSKLDVGISIKPYEVSITRNFVTVWLLLDGDQEVEEETKKFFVGILRKSFSSKNLLLIALNWLSEKPELTNRAICTTVRTHAPIEIEQLFETLSSGKYLDFTLKELANRLDILRKSGLILRLKSKNYVLTYKAFATLGTTKTASSPDITRMLALASREE